MLSLKSAGAVSSLRLRQSQSQASRQGKGKLLPKNFTPALHGAVCAFASGSTENRGLLTSQALLVSQASLGRQQAFVAPCANAAVIRILLGCQNWIPQLRAVDFCHVHKSTQSIAADASSALVSLELGDLLLPLLCCKIPVHLSSTCGALRPLSAAMNLRSESCAGRLVALCRTATHGDVCAYSDAFLSRGTRAERGFIHSFIH